MHDQVQIKTNITLEMGGLKFNFFLDEMIMRRNRVIVAKLGWHDPSLHTVYTYDYFHVHSTTLCCM
jgi:hypothetical protein